MGAKDAAQVRDALQAIAAAHGGRLTPEAVVQAAGDEESPLHAHFCWDDDRAAHLFRIEQARTLIRSVRVDIVTETRTVSTVYYVRDPSLDNGEQGYVSLPRLKSDKELARAALVQEFGRAAAALYRAHGLADALEMTEEVGSVIRQLDALREQMNLQDAA